MCLNGISLKIYPYDPTSKYQDVEIGSVYFLAKACTKCTYGGPLGRCPGQVT